MFSLRSTAQALKAGGDLQWARSSFHKHDALASPSGEDGANLGGDRAAWSRCAARFLSQGFGKEQKMGSYAISHCSLRTTGGSTQLSPSPMPVKHKSAIAHIWLSRFTIASADPLMAFQKLSLFEEPFRLEAVAIVRCSKILRSCEIVFLVPALRLPKSESVLNASGSTEVSQTRGRGSSAPPGRAASSPHSYCVW